MAEYILRDSVEKMLENAQIISDGVYSGYCTEDICVSDIPTADVAPVIYCKECKHGKPYRNMFGYPGFQCDLLCVDLPEDAFCSYGERVTNGWLK